jgi:hypothetical protein
MRPTGAGSPHPATGPIRSRVPVMDRTSRPGNAALLGRGHGGRVRSRAVGEGEHEGAHSLRWWWWHRPDLLANGLCPPAHRPRVPGSFPPCPGAGRSPELGVDASPGVSPRAGHPMMNVRKPSHSCMTLTPFRRFFDWHHRSSPASTWSNLRSARFFRRHDGPLDGTDVTRARGSRSGPAGTTDAHRQTAGMENGRGRRTRPGA